MKIVVITSNTGIYGLEPSLYNTIKGFTENSKNIAVFDKTGQHTLIDLSRNYMPIDTIATIILVSDQVEISDQLIGAASILNNLIGQDDLYIIYHDNPLINYEVKHQRGFQAHFGKQIKSEMPSRQISNSPHAKVFNLLVNWSIPGFNSLFSIFPDPILEAKLDLLHKCLLPSNCPTWDEYINEFEVLRNFRTNYKDFLNAKSSIKRAGTNEVYETSDMDVYHPDYIEAVKQLRIALLGS